jgi:hypothetical protein
MKKLIILLSCSILYSCGNSTEQWIKDADKPIAVYEGESGWYYKNRYTLIDASYNTHDTGNTKLKLPKTIK